MSFFAGMSGSGSDPWGSWGSGSSGMYGNMTGMLAEGTGSGGNQKINNTTTFTPWGPQGEALSRLYDRADFQLNQNLRAGPLDPSATTTQALSRMAGIAQGPNNGLQSALNMNQYATQGGFNMGTGGYQGMFNASGRPTALDQGRFAEIARGGNYTTGPDGNPVFDSSNPHRQAALDNALSSVNDSVRARMSSMGRYGSDAMGEALGREMGKTATDFNLQAYEGDQNRLMQAAMAQEQARQGRMGLGLSSLQGMQGALGQNAGIAQSAAQLAPQLSEARYGDATRLAGVGAARDQIAEDARNYGWGQMNQAAGIYGGLPGSAGTSTSTGPKPNSWLNLIGGIGAGIGGIGSIFGNLFGGS